MKRPLLLHIGLSKTGSSSIQRVLAEQRPAMRAQGVYLPTSPGWANHALLPAAAVNDGRILWGYHPGTWEGLSPAGRIARFREEFAAEMSRLPDDVQRVLITAEQIGGVIRHAVETQRLADMLAPYFSPIRVVVYLRRQDQHAASAYSEWLRGGVMREPGLPAGGVEKHPEYDYGEMLDRWASVFGDHAVTPRIFARDTLVDGDVVADFLQVADMILPALQDDPNRQSNPSLSLEGQGLLLAAGRRMEQRMRARGTPEVIWRDTPGWRRLATALTEAMPGRGWRPSRAEAQAFMERFAATNERARRRFFPDRASLFSNDFSDLPEHPSVAPPEAVTQAALDVLLHEVETSASREAAAAMAQYRLNRRLNDRPAMRTCLVRAIKFAPDLLTPRLRLADFLLEEGDVRQARQHAEAALRIAPDDAGALRLGRLTAGREE
jgi:hypothetical protein